MINTTKFQKVEFLHDLITPNKVCGLLKLIFLVLVIMKCLFLVCHHSNNL